MSALPEPHGEVTVRLRARAKLLVVDGGVLLSLGERRAKLRPFGERERAFLQALADGARPTEIRAGIAGKFGAEAGRLADGWIARLVAAGFCEDVDVEHGLDPDDVRRFDRLLHFFSEFETDGLGRHDLLARLRVARVALVGVGGMGSWIAYNLVCCGVGKLRLIDGDTVEMSNLNRSILFDEGSVGRSKVDAAAATLRRFAPRTHIDGASIRIDGPKDLAPHLGEVDLLISTVDQPAWQVRLWVTEACARRGVPNIQASGLRVGPLCVPGKTACCGCDWTRLFGASSAKRDIVFAQPTLPRGTTGALSPFGSIAAGVVAMDAVRFLAGFGEPFTLNAMWQMQPDFTTHFVPLLPEAGCPFCHLSGESDVEFRNAEHL